MMLILLSVLQKKQKLLIHHPFIFITGGFIGCPENTGSKTEMCLVWDISPSQGNMHTHEMKIKTAYRLLYNE